MKKILIALFVLPFIFACSSDSDLAPFEIIDNNKYQYDDIVELYDIPLEHPIINSIKDSILSFKYIQDSSFNLLVFKPKDKAKVSKTDLQYIIKDKIENEKIHLGFGEYFDFSPTIANLAYFERRDDLLVASIFLLNHKDIYLPAMYNLYICNGDKTTKISEIITNDRDQIKFSKTDYGYCLTCRLYGKSVYKYKYFNKSGDILRSIDRRKPLDGDINFITEDKAIKIDTHRQVELFVYDLNNEDNDTSFLFEKVLNPKLSFKNFSSFVESRILTITYDLVDYDGHVENIKHSINLDTKKVID